MGHGVHGARIRPRHHSRANQFAGAVRLDLADANGRLHVSHLAGNYYGEPTRANAVPTTEVYRSGLEHGVGGSH